jgi:hypothetical protein
MDGLDAGAPPPDASADPSPPAWVAPGTTAEMPSPSAPSAPAGSARPAPLVGGPLAVPVPLRPMTPTDIIDGALASVKIDPRTVLTVVGVFVVPLQLASAWASRHQFDSDTFTQIFQERGSVGPSTSGASTVSLLVSLVSYFALPFAMGAVATLLSAWYVGARPTAGDALRSVGRRWWQVILAWTFVSVCTGIGLVLLVMPGLILLTMFSVAVPAITVEGLGPIAGMKRSWALVRRRLWPTMGVLLLVLLVNALLGAALGALSSAVLVVSWGWIVSAAVGVISGVVTRAFVAFATVLLYLDLRIRTEGLDIEIEAGALFDSAV